MTQAFVGREAEGRRLLDAFTAAQAGKPRVLFIAGEAGAGKSSLVEAFTAQAQKVSTDVAVAVGSCDANTGLGDPYLPFFGIVAQLAGQGDAVKKKTMSEQSQSRLRRIAKVSTDLLLEYAPDLIGTVLPGSSLVVNVARKAAESAGLIDRLRSRFDAAEKGTVAVDQQRITESYTLLIRELSKRAPLILILDDLHWADAASCALLFHLMQQLKDARVLIVGTYRSNDVRIGRADGRHPLNQVINELKRYHGDIIIDLDAPDETARRAFVSAIVDSTPNVLGEGFRNALFRHTRGHALVTVEILRALQERGDLARDERGAWVVNRPIDWSVLPSRVEGIIAERIGRLRKDVRELLQIAAVQGEAFTVEILSRIGEVPERTLLKTLDELEKRHQLVAEGEVAKVGRGWVSHYNFTHAVFPQYLYEQLARRERMMLHRQIAEIMEELYADQRELVAAQLAHHFRLAGEARKAFDYAMQVAHRAMRIGAPDEVIAHAGTALALLAELPADQRTSTELDIQLMRGHALRIQQGWDGPDVVAAFERARALTEELPPDPRTYALLTATVVFGLWTSQLMRLELETSEETVSEVLQIAEKIEQIASGVLTADELRGVLDARMYAHQALGITYFWMGRIAESMEHSRKALELFAPERSFQHMLQIGHDPRSVVTRTLILCETVRGNADAARALRRELETTLENVQHPFSKVLAHNGNYFSAFIGRDPDLTIEESSAAIAECGDAGAAHYRDLPRLFIAWAEAVLGGRDGVARIDDAFRAANVNGGLLYHSVYQLMLAEAHIAHGAWNDALAAIASGLECAEARHELVFLAELHRARGDVHRYLGRLDDARADYERALEIARKQGAGLFERQALGALHDLESALQSSQINR